MNNLLLSIPFLAVLAPFILLWEQIKDLLQKIVRIFIIEVKLDADCSKAVTYFLAMSAKSLPTNTLRYDSMYEYVIKKKKSRLVLMQILAGLKSQLFWYKGTIISLSDLRGLDKETHIMTDSGCSIRFLRGTLDYERLLIDAVDWFEKRNDPEQRVRLGSNFYIRRFVGSVSKTPDEAMMAKKAAEMHAQSNNAPVGRGYESLQHNRLVNYKLEDLGYAKKDFYYVFNETTTRIHDDVVRWHKSKEWYQDKGLLHRRGALLHGPAGSGKTAAIRKIAQELEVPLFLFELNTMTDHEFIGSWDQVAGGSNPCVVVFEDIDCTFKKRENISKGGKLSFECVLNCISGVIPAEGVYLFVTTNRLDYLDDALGVPNDKGISTRPGRLDTCFEVGDITLEQKQKVAQHFLSDHPELIPQIIEKSNGCTAAQFSDMCSQKALELFWQSHEKN